LGGALYESRNGRYVYPHGVLRALIILVELDYADPDDDPVLDGTEHWPVHALPIWANNLDPNLNLFDADPAPIPQGMVTKYYHYASSGDFTLLADYLNPADGAIFHVATTNGLMNSPSATSATLAAVNAQMDSTFSTLFSHNSIDHFDQWILSDTNGALNGPGLIKTNSNLETPRKYDHVVLIYRNANDLTSMSGNVNPSSPGAIGGYGANTFSKFGGNKAPDNIMRHEFGHLLYGPNNFHTAGGGKDVDGSQYFITQSSGWSNMGLWNGSLPSWNGWDRQRMGWKAYDQTFEISARRPNMIEVNGDLDVNDPGDAGTYILRDFVTSGDAIRIKLPFNDLSNEYPEFLWVENHQGIGQNGSPFDKWLHESSINPCVEGLVPGVLMYMQIDKETRLSTSLSDIYSGPGDYLRPLDASGHYDIHFNAAIDTTYCVCWECPKYPFVRGQENPFTGSADRHYVALDLNANALLSYADHRLNDMEDVNGTVYDRLYTLGNARQVFTSGGNNKVGVGTNPSSATMMNLVGYDLTFNDPKDLRRIYLNGVSVELVAQNLDGSIEVNVRFDDVDVVNDVRWCADEIQLNPVATSTGYSLNVTAENTITLDRGTTATRRNNPEMYNGQQVFTSPTLMRCPANTWLNLAPGGGFVVDNGSTLRLEAGSRMDIGNGAVLRVKRGGKLELMGGSVLNILPGGQVIIEEDWQPGNHGRLVYHPDARINLEASNAVLEFAGVLDIQANATFTPARSGNPNNTYGLVKFTNTSPAASYNVAAGANSRFVLRGTSPNSRILHVQQESLYGPNALVDFSLLNGKATLAANARIVPPVAAAATVKFVNSVVTSSTGVRNSHRGVRLNGQPLLTLQNSTFSMGQYGVYSYNTTLGTKPAPLDCQFLDCTTGMYNYDKGINALGCSFNACDDGLVCEQMAQTSMLTDCTAQNNTGTGVRVQGSSVLGVLNPAFDHNTIGLDVGGATAAVACGSVSHNDQYGFFIHDGATLRLDIDQSGPHDPVTAVQNGVTIFCDQANNVYLDQGFNCLKPVVTGQQNTLYGTFLCQPYNANQLARSNNWNGSVGVPLTPADYAITACNGNLTFVDPSSSAETVCDDDNHLQEPGGAEQAGAMAPAAMAYCPDCALVEGADGLPLPLNTASA